MQVTPSLTMTSQATLIPSRTPTVTRSPGPTLSPTPTATVTSTPTPVGITSLENVNHFKQAVLIGDLLRQKEDYASAIVAFSDLLSYDLAQEVSEQVYSLRARCYQVMGDLVAANRDYLQVVALGGTTPRIENNLCWNYGLLNQPEPGLPYCEQAVKDNPVQGYLDSRGLVYALLGKTEDAIADFEAVMQYRDQANDPELSSFYNSRQAWLTDLKAGKNPFTPQVLAGLIQGDIRVSKPSVPSGSPNDRSREAFLQTAAKLGFSFSEVNKYGAREMVVGWLEKGDCLAGLTLLGPAQAIQEAVLHLGSSCELDSQDLVLWLPYQFLADPEDRIHALIWYIIDVNNVIDNITPETHYNINDVSYVTRKLPEYPDILEIRGRIP